MNPTSAWVRLAQRIPVGIKLDGVPDETRLVVGRTATVAVEPEGAASHVRLLGAWRGAPPAAAGETSAR